MLAPGEIIDGKYRIERCLAQGGMGAVFLGQNTRIGRQVAIKVLHGSLAKQGVQVERFEQEAQLLARIGSQYIVEVLDMGDLPGGDSYMVMEYLEGESLGERLQRRHRLTTEEAVLLVEQALAGLEAAHSAGVVHRDIKPDNLFLVRRPEGELVKILDFGVSKIEESAVNIRQSKLTLSGTLVGTPQYMSPEQARGHATDHRTDVFAMGIVLFECITGETPFVGENMQDLLFRVALEEPRTLSSMRPEIDPGIEAIERRATARAPEDRYQSAREFRDALRSWLDERGVVSVRPRTPAHLRRIVPTPAQLSSLGRGSDTPANWTTPPRGIASRPDIDSDDVAVAGLRPHKKTWLVGAALAAAAAVAIVISGFSSSSAAPTAATEQPVAQATSVAPATTIAESVTATTEPTRAATTTVSGTSGRGNTALASQLAAARAGLRRVPGADSAAPVEPVAPKGAIAAASAALVAPAAPVASAPPPAEPAAAPPPPVEASPAAPAPAPVQVSGPTPAVIPPTPKGRVFRRDL